MRYNLSPLIASIFFILFVLLTTPVQADFTFDDFSDTSTLHLNGDARPVSDVLRINYGSAWFMSQQFVRDGFETTFQFRITDLGGVGDCEGDDGGDGFAFVIQNESVSALGTAGGSLGYGGGGPSEPPGITNSLAVEFDTWCNSEFNDPNGNHLSVHTNGILPNDADEAFSLGASTAIPNLSDGSIYTVKIIYIPGTLSIFLNDLIILEVSVDLSITLDLDNGHAWVGFTAGIAGAFENHDFLSWSFREGTTKLTISPSSGTYVSTQRFDLVLIVETLGFSVTGGSATFDGTEVTGFLRTCIIPGTLVSGGQTFRCPHLLGETLGPGMHTLEVTLIFSDGSSATDTVNWEILENAEP